VTISVRLSVIVMVSLAFVLLTSCSTSSGSGTPPPVDYSIGGSVTNLTSGDSVQLQDNGGDTLTVTANGSFTFATKLASGAGYNVTVLAQPTSPTQVCTVTNASGTATANVTNVAVNCTTQYTIGGGLTNLASGDSVQLQDNGGDTLTMTASGPFTFATKLPSGAGYDVTVSAQPTSPAQVCTVTNASGTATANVTSVMVNCTTQYSIGGTVTNLASGDSVQLQDNGGDTLTVTANGPFTFDTKLASGTGYSVTVSAQPTSPTQVCTVANGSGTATADVNNVKVECGHNEWAWMAGSQLVNQNGTYGPAGTPGAAYSPGGRQTPATWADSSGNLWLFGGYGYDSQGTLMALSDLWEFSAGEWMWQGGSKLAGQSGNYGSLGVASANNYPGARFEAVSWTDASGAFWLFGGNGFDSVGTDASLNDLWKFSGGEWTWMGGSNVANQKGQYGTLGVANSNNFPGARDSAALWKDASGDVWMFGGMGYDASSTNAGILNDLWRYSGGQWTWMGGSDVQSAKGIYGTRGTAAPTNVPGARMYSYSWTDSSGNLWLFGGTGYDSNGTAGPLNDLWKYSSGQWTWMGGSDVVNSLGVYGTQGVAAASNVPGARQMGLAWSDASGNGWIFGGNGDYTASLAGQFNDLWKYSGGQWTWVSGSNNINQNPTYGTEGTLAPGNTPSSRMSLSGWIDANGNLWLLGGYGQEPGATGNLNDMWMYMP